MVTEGERVDLRLPQFDVGFINAVGKDLVSRSEWTDIWYAAKCYMSDDELRETVLTKAGLTKLHRQFWHLQADDLFNRIQLVVPDAKKQEVKDLCKQVVDECISCHKKARAGTILVQHSNATNSICTRVY